jgi:hypothetical protein
MRNHPTTQPGYKNRNKQMVVRKTSSAGNDNNQVVYELECLDCGYKYGANVSDIFSENARSVRTELKACLIKVKGPFETATGRGHGAPRPVVPRY